MPRKNSDGLVARCASRTSARLEPLAAVADEARPHVARRRERDPARGRRPSGSRCRRRARTCRRGRRTCESPLARARCSGTSPPSRGRHRGRRRTRSRRTRSRRGMSRESARPSMRSVMWTSTASKPARVNAAAISIWPLTPCSRRIATRGRAPRAMYGAAMSAAAIERAAAAVSPASPRSMRVRVLLVGARRVVAAARDLVRDVRPARAQLAARRVDQVLAARGRRGCASPCDRAADRVEPCNAGERTSSRRRRCSAVRPR